MLIQYRRLFVLVLVLATASLLHAAPAHAVATVQVTLTGQAIGETTLQLVDANNQVVQPDRDREDRRRAGLLFFSNLRPGAYRAQTVQGGRVVGERTIQIADGTTTNLRVDTGTGTIATAGTETAPAYTMPRFAFGLLGGLSRTSYDGNASSTALTFDEEDDIDGWNGFAGIDGRYYFSPLQQQLTALQLGPSGRLFVAAAALYYFGNGEESLFARVHNAQRNDTGIAVDRKWAVRLALGATLPIYQAMYLSVMAGAQLSRTEVEGISLETLGGGAEDQRFNRSKTQLSPYVGVELSYPLNSAGELSFGIGATYARDINVRGESTNFGFDYNFEAEGGLQPEAYLRYSFTF